MLDTKGDTAVYLLFAYARLVSILRKGNEEHFVANENGDVPFLSINDPSERALAFEILQFGDTIKRVCHDLSPNQLCDYVKEICVKFTDFVTKCHVLNADSQDLKKSRLILCEATRKIMITCFNILGIEYIERI
jgi:arginyl-tRNA synthetase